MNKIRLLFASVLSLGLLAGCNSEPTTETTSTDSTTQTSTSTSTSDTTTSEDPHDRDPSNPYRILFLGNSLIFFNDMPKIFGDLCLNEGIPMVVDSVTQGSCTMSLLATTETQIGQQAYLKLTTQRWDYVVIEPSRRATPFEETVFNAELDAAVVLDELARGAGAETLIYSVWGLNKGETGVYQQADYDSIKIGTHEITRSAHCNYMNYFGEAVSERLGGRRIVKAGYAFENSIATFPTTNLYHTDNQHPNPTGSYLVACTFFSTIFNLESKSLQYNYTIGDQAAFNMKFAADLTVIEKVVPSLDPIPDPDPITPEEEYDHTVLFIGAPTIMRDDYLPLENYTAMMANIGKKVRPIGIFDGTYSMKDLATTGNTKNSELRAHLGTYDFDAIVIQISRRATVHSTDVSASELAAITSLKELLHSETDNIFIFAPKGEASQYTFSVNPDNGNYVKGAKETASNAEMCQFYSSLSETMADAIDCKPMKYASAYREYAEGYAQDKAGVGYLYQCCFYNSFFQEAIPTTCTWQNGCSNENAAIIRGIAAKYCLPQA